MSLESTTFKYFSDLYFLCWLSLHVITCMKSQQWWLNTSNLSAIVHHYILTHWTSSTSGLPTHKQCVWPTSIKSRFSWTRFNVDRRFEPSSSHDVYHQRKTLISWRGSAEPRWLYVLDADWSDLIEISDVTRTVYITFDPQLQERRQVANVFSLRNVFLCSHFAYPTITAEKFEGGQIALTLIRYC